MSSQQQASDRLLLESFTRPENAIAAAVDAASAFLTEHGARLSAIEAAANPHGSASFDGASDAVLLSCRPAERVDAVALVATGDDEFNRVVRTLGALTDEAVFLRDVARERVYAPLSLFGAVGDDDGSGLAVGEGLLEAMVGKALPRLADVANFSARAAALAANMAAQLAGLLGRGSPLAPAWSEVRLRPFFFALGDLLTSLITIDAIVRGNKMVRAHAREGGGGTRARGDGEARRRRARARTA